MFEPAETPPFDLDALLVDVTNGRTIHPHTVGQLVERVPCMRARVDDRDAMRGDARTRTPDFEVIPL
jgi:hypothetical protein